jgi:GrpB-like predicted nucleotidyltransferase (UPF0157 family)
MKGQGLLMPYQDRWIDDFNAIQEVLLKVVGSAVRRIEHVGSTAVPGLLAKPIIDIDIEYRDKADFEKIREGLLELGYWHVGDQGIPDREVFKRKGESFHEVLDGITHHLYVCSSESEAMKAHLLFRDALRKYEQYSNAYAALKIAVAETVGQDRKKYAALKELMSKELVQEALRKVAEEWE